MTRVPAFVLFLILEGKLSAFLQVLSELWGFKNSLYQVEKYSSTSSVLSTFIKKKCWL